MQNLIALGFMARYSDISKVFPLTVQVKPLIPGVGSYLTRGLYLALLVKVHYIRLHAKFGKPRPHA